MKTFLFPILLIFGAILLRGVSLETLDLLDPTESRYALVAEEMHTSGDWITPKLPLKDGSWVPYLGKPPLHFWLTALSYQVFGVEEWTARLPSFLALLGIAASIFYLGITLFNINVASTAVLLLMSSGLAFFMAGASVVDFTLSLFVTLAITSAIAILHSESHRYLKSLIFFASLALGFLTKGPVALVLVAFPLVVWSLVQRDFRLLKRLPWIPGILLSIVVTLPWFMLAQRANPDFLRYFFFVENFGRYLVTDYGDLYGQGHVHFYGSSWWMFAVGFLPWTAILLAKYRSVWQLIRHRSSIEDSYLKLFLFWGLAPVVFFTLARQILPAYFLPGFGGVALVAAALVQKAQDAPVPRRLSQISVAALILIALGMFIASLQIHESWFGVVAVVGLSLMTFFVARAISQTRTQPEFVRLISFGVVLMYTTTTVAVSPFVNFRRSTEEILKIALNNIPGDENQIGIVNRTPYSSYWYARNWKIELPEPVRLKIVPQEEILAVKVRNLVIDRKTFSKLPLQTSANFAVKHDQGKWLWIQRLKPTSRRAPALALPTTTDSATNT